MVPILLIQKDNKAVVYRTLILMSMLTEPICEAELADYQGKETLIENCFEAAEALVQKDVIDLILEELAGCLNVKPGERNDYQSGTIDAIVTLFRNCICQKPGQKQKARDAGLDFFSRTVLLFAQPRGVFDALVYMSQTFDASNYHTSTIFL